MSKLIWYYYKLKLMKFIENKETLLLIRDDILIEMQAKIPVDYFVLYSLFEEYYVLKFIDEAPDIIKRAMHIKEVFHIEAPADDVILYCKEAYLTYINGLHNASAIILRSIIEEALKRKMGLDDNISLAKCNDEALSKGIYLKDSWEKVDKIRKDGRGVAHRIRRTKISEERNSDLIQIAQDVLKKIL